MDELWALIICGWPYYGMQEGEDGMQLDPRYMRDVLVNHYSFDQMRLIEYFEVGYKDKEWLRGEIRNWFQTDGNDLIFIFFMSHGARRGDGIHGDPVDEVDGIDEGLGLKEVMGMFLFPEVYWDDEFKEDLDYLAQNGKYGRLILQLQANYTGGFIRELSAPKRIIITACGETEHATYDYLVPEVLSTHVGGFSRPFIHALNPNESFDIADTSNDNYVSMWEAFEYARQNNIGRRGGPATPQLEDNGNIEVNRFDGLLSMETCFASGVNLKTPDIVEDGIVDIFDAISLAGISGSVGPCPCDLNNDLIVDIYDAMMLSNAFAKWYPAGIGGSSCMEATTSLSVYPEETTVYEHQAFLVGVAVTNVTDLYGYEFKLYYNATVLNCTGVDFPSDHFLEPDLGPDNLWIVKKEYDNSYNSTHGRVWVAVALMSDEPGKNGSGTLATINFTAVSSGSSMLDLHDVKLGNSQAEAIPVTLVDGSVTVLSIYHMRSDTHTVNGLTAYKLGATQTANSKYFMKDANGRKDVSWGIRVWKRNSAGQETEITSGSPVAIVTRTSDGEGIQSAAWNCPETSLETSDAIVVRVYQRFGQGGWVVAAEFTTEQLDENKPDSAIWTAYYYTSRSYLPGYPPYFPPTTTGWFYWGNATYNSHIEIEPN